MDNLTTVQMTDRLMRLLRKTGVERLTDEPQGLSNGVGRTFYVDSGSTNAAATNSGLEPLYPFATLAQAVDASSDARGDVIVLMSGHAETLTAILTISKSGLTIVGLGNGRNRPAFTFNHTVDGFDLTGANIKVSNLHFVTPSAAATADINVNAADCEIEKCEFTQGANSTDAITIPDGGDRAFIHDCVFRVTANGPTSGITIESASTDGVRLERLRGHGGSVTNAWDNGFIYSTVATTDLLAMDVVSDFGPALILTGAATGLVKDLFAGEIAAGATQANFGTGTVMVVGGPVEGYLTRRATADILTAGSTNIFTVTGRVIMTRLVYEVTTVIGAGADTIAILYTPTGGDAATIAAASASIATKAVGDTFGFSPSLLVGTYTDVVNVAGVAPIGFRVVLKAGVMANVSTNNTTGSMKIDIYWIPEGPGSGVVIA